MRYQQPRNRGIRSCLVVDSFFRFVVDPCAGNAKRNAGSGGRRTVQVEYRSDAGGSFFHSSHAEVALLATIDKLGRHTFAIVTPEAR